LLRYSRNVPGDAKPILLSADEVYTWVEGGRRAVVARGQVLVQQSIVHLRCQQVVFWVDVDRLKKTGILHADVYGEGQVRLDLSSKVDDAEKAVLDLNTRGEMRLNAYRSKVQQLSVAADPLVARARAAIGGPVAAPPATSTAPMPPQPPAVLQRTSYQEPVLPAQAPGPAAVPTPTTPPATQILPPVVPPGPPAPAPPGTTLPSLVPATPAPDPRSEGPAPGALPAPGAAAAPIAGSPGPVLPQSPGPTPLPPPSKAAAPPPKPPVAENRQYSISPRSGGTFNIKMEPLGNGELAVIVTGGVILTVRNVQGIGLLDIEADRLVIWTRNVNAQQLVQGISQPEGQSGRDLEFYLSGNVEIRQQGRRDTRTIRADEVYYDVNRNTAIATKAQFDLKDPKLPEPVTIRTPELHQLAANQYEFVEAEISASKLPSDPGLKVYVREGTIEDRKIIQTSIFGWQVIDRKTGQPAEVTESRVISRGNTFYLQDVPFFYLPYASADARDPLGPLVSVSFGFNHIYGFTSGVTLDVYKLLGIQTPQGHRWTLDVDDLSYRGPALGTNYDYTGKDLFGIPSTYQGLVKGWAMYDRNFDRLGGPSFRDEFFSPPNFRGRLLWREQVMELPEGFSVQSQFYALSDRNFLEQYFKFEYDRDLAPDSYLYVKQQQGQWAWTGLAQPRLLDWITTTESLPRFDGWLLGQSFFDTFTYNAHASAGYFQLRPTSDQYPPNSELGLPRPVYPNPFDVRNFFPRVSPTDVYDRTARFDVFQELSAPFTLGAFRIVPYGKLDLAAYTGSTDTLGPDKQFQDIGRVWGEAGVRASIPFSRLFPDVNSELFNVNGIYHKITLSANALYAESNEPYTRFAQLDRFNDPATDQSIRDIRPDYPTLYGAQKGTFLAVSPLFDPQIYAIRRGIDSNIDTLDSVEILQLDLFQRWQTKRGYPGAQHVIDWMVLDLSASYFPNSQRDNFGKPWGMLEYDYLWNVGDRTAITSSGWYEPASGGPRYFDIGAFFNRPDRTNFSLVFRYTDPLESRVLTGAVTYIFSPKYSMTFASSYDFGLNQSQANSLVFSRVGTDLQVNVGFTYNALQNNFGFTFEIFPNLVPLNRRGGYGTALGQGGLLGR
jgi:hypothetical protein